MAEGFPGAIRSYLQALREDLACRAENDDALEPFVGNLSRIETDRVQAGPLPRLDHPAMSLLRQAVDAAKGNPALLDAAAAASEVLDWSQTYAGGGIDPDLEAGMLSAQAVGTYGCFPSGNTAAGQFLLAPGLFYPLHNHVAREIYYCISGSLRIWHGLEGSAFELEAGDHSVTPSNRVHALEVGDQPALLLYVWIDDLHCPVWWWGRDDNGNWQRTQWRRVPPEPWRSVRTEPATEELIAQANGE